MKRLLIFLSMFFVMPFCAYPSAVSADEITVSAAISLKNAFEEIAKLYGNKYTGTKVRLNFGASGDLVSQIMGGAPVDVFASAAQKDMDDLTAKGYIVPGSRADFVKNTIVLITPKPGPVKSFRDLASGKVKLIAAGNPNTVPAGRYAAEIFDFYKITGSVKDKLVYAENVRQVLDYVARGEVDAGIVYATDAAVRPAETHIAVEAPDGSHKPVIYPIAAVKGTKYESAARAFIDMVLSEEGGAILKKYGFRLADK
jgi:molybdate transport system substrate-binding protein